MCLLASTVWGQTVVTFIPGETVGNNETASGADEMSKDGITVTTTSGGFKAAQYRFAKNSVTTFTSSIGNITSIEFTCSASGTTKYGPGCFAAQDGYSYEDNIGTWVGSAESVQFTAETNQVRATKIVVTVGGNGLASPSIKPAAGTYYSPIEVTITCGTNGAKIYYTTNGNDPTTSSSEYTAPFTLSSNTTVKAISAKDGGVSPVVTAAYEFMSATPVANIAAYQAVEDNTVVAFTNPVNVLAQSGSRMFVKDDTGYALFYGNCGQTYVNGDVIPAGFAGTKTTYDGEPELKDLQGFAAKSGNSPIAPEEITASQVSAALYGHYVILYNVTFDTENRLVMDASGEAPYYCNMNVAASEITAETTYDSVVAIVGSYGKESVVYQLLPVILNGGGSVTPPVGTVGLGDLVNIEDNTEVTFGYDATVLWQGGNNNNYLYLKDETGFGLVYGPVGQTYTIGNVIPKGFSGKKTTYKDEPEVASPQNFAAATSTVSVTPKEITPAGVNHDNWANYVLLKNVTVDVNAMTLTDANGNSCAFYNTFNIDLVSNGNHDVYGIVGKHNAYQILPISFDEAPTPPDPVVPIDVASIEELYNLDSNQQGHFTTPLTAVYQNGINLYVKDVEGKYSLAYGAVDGEFVNGDYINDAVATWSEYQGAKQIKPVGNTFVVAGHGDAVQPEEMPIEEISQDMAHTYFGFKNVTIVERDGNLYLVDETGEMQLFDKFNVLPEEGLDLSKNYDVKAFLTLYKGLMELYPISVVEHGQGAVDETLSGKTIYNVRYFNVAGQEMKDVNGLTIVVTTYTDGTTSAVKVIK